MKLEKATKRDRKRTRRKHGMRISGRSIFTIVEQQVKRSKKIKQEDRNG